MAKKKTFPEDEEELEPATAAETAEELDEEYERLGARMVDIALSFHYAMTRLISFDPVAVTRFLSDNDRVIVTPSTRTNKKSTLATPADISEEEASVENKEPAEKKSRKNKKGKTEEEEGEISEGIAKLVPSMESLSRITPILTNRAAKDSGKFIISIIYTLNALPRDEGICIWDSYFECAYENYWKGRISPSRYYHLKEKALVDFFKIVDGKN